MTLRCGCPNDGDETVFGPNHRCSVDPKPPADLPRFVPSSWFVVPQEEPAIAHGYEPEPYGSGLCICGRADDHDVHWPAQEPCPVTRVEIPDPRYDENPIHLLLGPDELED